MNRVVFLKILKVINLLLFIPSAGLSIYSFWGEASFIYPILIFPLAAVTGSIALLSLNTSKKIVVPNGTQPPALSPTRVIEAVVKIAVTGILIATVCTVIYFILF